MKNIFLSFLIFLSVSAVSQTINKFERLPNDEFQLHCSLHSLETSDGNIVLMEECFNIVDGNCVDAGVNLLKINTDGKILNSKFVEFRGIQYDNPFIKNPFEENSNLMAGFIFNESEAKYYYTAVFFDDELNITETVETPIEVEGFDEYCDLFFDNNSNNLIMVYKSKSEENTYVYAKMDIYGEIININYSSLQEYSTTSLGDSPLFVYSADPLQYGCMHIINPYVSGDHLNRIVIMNEDMEVVEVKELGIGFDGEYQFAIGENRLMTGMSDGTILEYSRICSTIYGEKDYLQITKYDKDLNVIDCARITNGWDSNSKENASVECIPIECKDGSIYVIWRYRNQNDYIYTYFLSKLDNNLNVKWERSITSDSTWNVLWMAFLMENETLVINGYKDAYLDYGVEDNVTICFFIHGDGKENETMASSEFSAYIRPYSFYPNPVEDKINIRFSPDIICEKVEIFGLDGKLYHEQNFNLETINIDDLSTGIYMMKLQLINGNIFTEKVIKK